MPRWVVTIFILSALGVLAPPSASAAPQAPRGWFVKSFDERHPLGKISPQCKRFGWTQAFIKRHDARGGVYDPKKEGFQIYVPKTYDAAKPAGLFVWISPGDTGRMPQSWVDVLGKRNLIGIGPDRAGNDREIWYRVALALDAVHNMKKLYAIDPARIYVAGFSGGGRLASRVGLHYADVFTGGIYMGGCNFWRSIPKPGPGKMHWPRRFPKPSGTRYAAAKRTSRHVILVGGDDFNRPHSRGIFEQITKKDRFRWVTWMEMPGVGHTWPDGAWIAKAIDDGLDAPLEKMRAEEKRKKELRAQRRKRRSTR